jgi:hypothetical protein
MLDYRDKLQPAPDDSAVRRARQPAVAAALDGKWKRADHSL